jgi:hypothetical protein
LGSLNKQSAKIFIYVDSQIAASAFTPGRFFIVNSFWSGETANTIPRNPIVTHEKTELALFGFRGNGSVKFERMIILVR